MLNGLPAWSFASRRGEPRCELLIDNHDGQYIRVGYYTTTETKADCNRIAEIGSQTLAALAR